MLSIVYSKCLFYLKYLQNVEMFTVPVESLYITISWSTVRQVGGVLYLIL